MRNFKNRVFLTFLFGSLPLFASANMIWPSIYIVEQYYSWYIIFVGLLIEIVAAHLFLKTDWKKSIYVSRLPSSER